MPIGQEYKFGPVRVGPFYNENLPFGLGPGSEWLKNNVSMDSPAVQGAMHPWPWYMPGTDKRTPFGDAWGQVGEAMGTVPAALWEGTKQLGNFFGVGPGPLPEGNPPVPEVMVNDTPAPEQRPDPFAALLNGLNGTPTTIAGGKVPGPVDYSRTRSALEAARPNAVSGPDYSKAREYLEGAKPTGASVTPDDKMFFILNGLSKAGLGAADSGDLGDILFALGMGALGGYGQYGGAMQEDRRRLQDQNREYAGQMAQFETGAADNEFKRQSQYEDQRQRYELGRADTEAGIARDGQSYAMDLFKLTSPKFDNGHIITGDVGSDGNLNYSMTPVMSPELGMKMKFLAAAGGTPVNVAQVLLSGQEIPGLDPETNAMMRAKILQDYQAMLADSDTQDMLLNMTGNGTIDIKSDDAMRLLMSKLDSQIQAGDPQVYSSILAALQQQQMLRALAGNVKPW